MSSLLNNSLLKFVVSACSHWVEPGNLRSEASSLVVGLLHLHPILHWSRPVWRGLKHNTEDARKIQNQSGWEHEETQVPYLVRPDVLQAGPAHKVAAHHSTLLFLQEAAGRLTPFVEFCKRGGSRLSLSPSPLLTGSNSRK